MDDIVIYSETWEEHLKHVEDAPARVPVLILLFNTMQASRHITLPAYKSRYARP